MIDVREIINLMESPTADDIALITKAYNFAENAHKAQKRFSGEPYFIHPFETTKILASIKMNVPTLCAGLLHDTIEDGCATPEEIKKEFSDEILFLVNGVSKLGKIKYRGGERYILSLQKLFVAISKDIRVLIIKLADRLHNMRTLQYVRPEKQHRIALETLEIFAPLAYRLGIRKLSGELEDLSFTYANPVEANLAKEYIKEKSKENLPILEKFIKSLKKALAKEGVTNISTDYRTKGLLSFYRKLIKKEKDIEKIYDVLAVRVITDTVSDCYKILGIIHGEWRPLPGRIKDYIAVPKPNGYQSLHTTVFTGDGGIVEIQIRTKEMHRNAEYGIASHLSFKENGSVKPAEENESFTWFKQFLPKSIPFISNNTKSEFLNNNIPSWIKELSLTNFDTNSDGKVDEEAKTDFFAARMFIFTPKGDVVDLPGKSTPIDFAYAIHSDIGNHVNGAKVNGKMVTLDTELKNMDIVEIITKESAKPSTKWLDHVKTNLAKRHIRFETEIKKPEPKILVEAKKKYRTVNKERK
jgi:GTP pyrophosphokinase